MGNSKNNEYQSPVMTAEAILLKWNDIEGIFNANEWPIYDTDDAVIGLPLCLSVTVDPYSGLEPIYHPYKEYPPVLMLSCYESGNGCKDTNRRKKMKSRKYLFKVD